MRALNVSNRVPAILLLILFPGIAVFSMNTGAAPVSPPSRTGPKPRMYRPVGLTITVKIPELTGEAFDLFIPIPRMGDFQRLASSKASSPVPGHFMEYDDLGLRYWTAHFSNRDFKNSEVVIESLVIVRRFHLRSENFPGVKSWPPAFDPFLRPIFTRALRSTDIEKIAAELNLNTQQPLVERARMIYQALVKESSPKMLKNEDPIGCDRGSVLFAALARYLSIPARITYGYAIPDYTAGKILRTLCWAEFYVPSIGWVPADVRRGVQNPRNHLFYFGSRLMDRLALTPAMRVHLRTDKAKIVKLVRFDRPVIRLSNGRLIYPETRIVFQDKRRRDIPPNTIIKTIEERMDPPSELR